MLGSTLVVFKRCRFGGCIAHIRLNKVMFNLSRDNVQTSREYHLVILFDDLALLVSRSMD